MKAGRILSIVSILLKILLAFKEEPQADIPG